MNHSLTKYHSLEIISCLKCIVDSAEPLKFLNQACAGRKPAHAWFLKIVSVQMSVCVCVCVFACACVCPPLRLLITGGVMWHDMNPIWLVKQVLQLLYGNCSWYHQELIIVVRESISTLNRDV